MRRRSAISWTSIVEDEVAETTKPDALDADTPTLRAPVSPPLDWEGVLGPMRDRLAAIMASPSVRADDDARAILLKLSEIEDLEQLDAAMDELGARLDAVAEDKAARFRPSRPITAPAPEAWNAPSQRAPSGRRILRL